MKRDDPKFIKKFRAEIDRRTRIVIAERAKLPKKLTAKQATRLHKFGFTHESVAQEILAK